MHIHTRHTLTLLIGAFVLLLPAYAFGQAPSYTPLVGLPGVTDLKTASFGEYINALYTLTISIGAIIGVFRITMAGVKYSMSDVVTSKGEAINDIQGVLIGLGILLIPFIVLTTINPNLVNLDVLKLNPADRVDVKKSGAGAPGTNTNTNGGGGGGNLGSSMTTASCPTRYRKSEERGCKQYNPEITSCTPEVFYYWDTAGCQSWCSGLPSSTYLPGSIGDRPSCRYSLSVEVTGS